MSNTMRKFMNFPVGLATTATASNDNDIPNRAQIVAMIAGKVNVKDSVIVTTDANVDLATGGLLTVDGVTLSAGDRVLVRLQTDASENGIYIADSGSWTRASDADEDGELKSYTAVFVRQGTEHAGHKYVLQSTDDVVIGTDDQTWVHESAASTDAGDITTDQTNFTVISGATVQAALDSIDDTFVTVGNTHDADIARLEGLAGVAADATHLGTFTGDTISDNTDVKTALQELETAVEAGRYESTGTSLTTGNAITFNHNLGTRWLSSIAVYEASTGEDITHTVTITAVDTANVTVQNDDVAVTAIVVCRA